MVALRAVANEVHECERCAEANGQDRDLIRLDRQLKSLRDLIAPIVVAARRAVDRHLRCAVCGILAGPGHLETVLVPEPLEKPDRALEVCPSCHDHLARFNRTVAGQAKVSKAIVKGLSDTATEEVVE